MQETLRQLEAAHTQMAALADVARQAQAEAADAKAMNDVLQSQFKDLQQAVMVLSARSSIAVTTPDSIQHSAGRNLTFTAGEDADMGVMGKLRAAAGEMISLFAQKMGIQIIANRGKVAIQAQNDAMALSALKDLSIASVDGKLILSAKNEVWIGAAGSYIRINSTRIESGTPGDILEKGAAWQKRAPGSEIVKDTLPWTSDPPDLKRHGSKFSG